MPHKACLAPGCGEWAAPKGRGRCPKHSKERDASIDRAGRATYSTKKWQLTRRRKLSQSPICEQCQKELADTVHHKVDIAEGGERYAMGNLQSLCASCHSKEGRMRQMVRHT